MNFRRELELYEIGLRAFEPTDWPDTEVTQLLLIREDLEEAMNTMPDEDGEELLRLDHLALSVFDRFASSKKISMKPMREIVALASHNLARHKEAVPA